jgi:glycerophosphoryl diester phosphodiesterase
MVVNTTLNCEFFPLFSHPIQTLEQDMTNHWRRDSKPLIIAHRGQGVEAPENTLPAYQLAVDLGAEMIETDVNITSDGILVMSHDWYLGRTTDIKGAVHDLTLEEIQKADAGAWFAEKFKGVRIPTTEQALEFAKKTGTAMCFEVKGGNPKRGIVIAEKLVELFKKYDAFEWAFMSSYHHEALAAAKKIAPQLMLAPERLPDDVEPDISEALRQVNSLKAEVLQIHYQYLHDDFMQAMHRNEIAIWAWPATDEAEIQQAIRNKADGIMGDDVRKTVELLNKVFPT